MYTWKDLRDGKIQVYNDNFEKLSLLLKKAFPLASDHEPANNFHFYCSCQSDNINWMAHPRKISNIDKCIPASEVSLEYEFVLPDKWAIKLIANNFIKVNTYINQYKARYGEYHTRSYGYIHSERGNGHGIYDEELQKGFTEITTEQFDRYVLNVKTEKSFEFEPINKGTFQCTTSSMPDRKIIGYKAPFDLYDGYIGKGDVWIKADNYIGILYIHGLFKDPDKILPREIVETWEPVYEETAPKKTDPKVMEYLTEIQEGLNNIHNTINELQEVLKK